MTLYFGIEQQRCPHCGKISRVFRFGALLTPIKAEILDLIKKRPGISRETINRIVFDNETGVHNVAQHVSQINDALAHTDYTITGHRYHGYRLKRRCA